MPLAHSPWWLNITVHTRGSIWCRQVASKGWGMEGYPIPPCCAACSCWGFGAAELMPLEIPNMAAASARSLCIITHPCCNHSHHGPGAMLQLRLLKQAPRNGCYSSPAQTLPPFNIQLTATPDFTPYPLKGQPKFCSLQLTPELEFFSQVERRTWTKSMQESLSKENVDPHSHVADWAECIRWCLISPA